MWGMAFTFFLFMAAWARRGELPEAFQHPAAEASILRFILRTLLLLFGLAPLLWGVDDNVRITQYAHSAWRLQDGVINGEPLAITQTTDGYMWVGTANGLLRFAGVRFVPCFERWAAVFEVGLLASSGNERESLDWNWQRPRGPEGRGIEELSDNVRASEFDNSGPAGGRLVRALAGS